MGSESEVNVIFSLKRGIFLLSPLYGGRINRKQNTAYRMGEIQSCKHALSGAERVKSVKLEVKT
jgi:hypothetical protein